MSDKPRKVPNKEERIRELGPFLIPPNSECYVDVAAPIDPSVYKNIPKTEVKELTIVNYWKNEKTNLYLKTTTSFLKSLKSIEYLVFKDFMGNLDNQQSFKLFLETTNYLGLKNNENISPLALKELIIYSITDGKFLFKFDYILAKTLKDKVLHRVVEFFVLLVNATAIPVSSVLANQFFAFYPIMLTISLFFSYNKFSKIVQIKTPTIWINKLYTLGLISNNKYVDESDLDIVDNPLNQYWCEVAVKVQMDREGISNYDNHKEIKVYSSLFYSPNIAKYEEWPRYKVEMQAQRIRSL